MLRRVPRMRTVRIDFVLRCVLVLLLCVRGVDSLPFRFHMQGQYSTTTIFAATTILACVFLLLLSTSTCYVDKLQAWPCPAHAPNELPAHPINLVPLRVSALAPPTERSLRILRPLRRRFRGWKTCLLQTALPSSHICSHRTQSLL